MKILKKKKKEETTAKKKDAFPSEKNEEMTPAQIYKEIQNHIDQTNQKKEEIYKLTQSISEELQKIRELRQKMVAQEEKKATLGSKAKIYKRQKAQIMEPVELDYELANMNMIGKLLDLSENIGLTDDENLSTVTQRKSIASFKRRKKHKKEDEKKNGQEKILVVEDDPTTTSILSFVLAQHNFRVISSQNAEDGLKMTLKEKPNLIILDIMLPGMDGFQFLSILKENDETSQIPVVLISSLTGEKDILKGLEIGANDYILKPFSPQILYLKVKKIMGLRNGNIAHHHRL